MSTVDDLATANELIRELVAHLEYCGWGDRWERECSEPLQARAAVYLDRLDDSSSASPQPVVAEQVDLAPLITAMRQLDCGDNSCEFAQQRTGMRTNGGCRCLPVKTAVRVELIKLWRRFR